MWRWLSTPSYTHAWTVVLNVWLRIEKNRKRACILRRTWLFQERSLVIFEESHKAEFISYINILDFLCTWQILHNCAILELRKRANMCLFLPTGPASVLPCFCIFPVRPLHIPSVDWTRSRGYDDGDLIWSETARTPWLTTPKWTIFYVNCSTHANRS